MKRTYLALAGLALAASAVPAALAPLARGAAVFDSRPVEDDSFSVLARPVGEDRWNLVVLEQIAAEPLCWEERPDGLIHPALNGFDFSGICGRYLDSNGYSLRIGEEDLAARYRLRLQQEGGELQLQATSSDHDTVLVVARAPVPARGGDGRDRDGFVGLRLEPGWSLQRRVYQEQTLNHLYFANGTALGELLVAAGQPQPQPEEDSSPTAAVRPAAAKAVVASPFARRPSVRPTTVAAAPTSRGVIPLEVVPYREVSSRLPEEEPVSTTP